LLSPAIAIWFDCGLLAVLCRHLATENVMKLLLAFGYVAARGRGLLCRTPLPPQLVAYVFCDIGLWSKYSVTVFKHLEACYNKCIKSFIL